MVDSKGAFIGMDLGDNDPRGIHLHYITPQEITSRVAYGFKTNHQTEQSNSKGVKFDE